MLCSTPAHAREALRQMAGKLSAMQAAFNQACDHRDEAQARVVELEAFRLARIGEPTMAEVDAENDALRSRVSELEEIARLAAASVRNQAWAGICDDDILLEQALVKANFI